MAEKKTYKVSQQVNGRRYACDITQMPKMPAGLFHEYKKESFRMYHELNDLIRAQVVYSIYKTGDALNMAPEILANFASSQPKNLKFAGAVKDSSSTEPQTIDLVHEKVKDASGKTVGRNDLCPCGSGKKFKKCCGK